MHNGTLKKLRVILSLLFFLVISALFIDFSGKLLNRATHVLLNFQFVPSLIQFITLLEVVSGFFIILILTLLFGRIYCSTLCPMGTLQDIITWFIRRIGRKKAKFRYSKPLNLLRYSILLVTAVTLISGTILMVDLLDPYSSFGRIFHNLFQPLYIGANNLLSLILDSMKVYSVAPVKWAGISWLSFMIAFLWLGLIIVLAMRWGRLYCNTICPVGALLGLFSKISLFRIKLDQLACTSCGKCAVVCKAQCIDVKEKKVDFSRCIGCMNCLTPCPAGGVKILPAWKKESTEIKPVDTSRRSFIKRSSLMIAFFAGLQDSIPIGQEKKKEVIPGVIPINRENPVTPPGSLGIERFNDTCTACHLCVSACPTHVIQPSVFEYGLAGLMQPRMDFITNFCNYECILCCEICPTGALLPLKPEDKKLTQLGKSKFVKENCVVYTRNTDCGACSEHCPTKAVNMVPYTGRLTIPKVNEDICVGCGACEYACPTDPKSIYVEGNRIHLTAQPPKKEKALEEENLKEEFPF